MYVSDIQASNVTLSNTYLKTATASNLYVSDIQASNVTLSNTYLKTATASNLYVSDIQASNVTLSNTYLMIATASNMYVSDIQASNVTLSNTYLKTATASNLYVSDIQASNVTLSNTYLMIATASNLYVSDIQASNVALSNSYLKTATASNLYVSDIQASNVTLSNTYLKVASASNMYFTFVEASNATLSNTYLKIANVSNLFVYDVQGTCNATFKDMNASNITITTIRGGTVTASNMFTSNITTMMFVASNATIGDGVLIANTLVVNSNVTIQDTISACNVISPMINSTSNMFARQIKSSNVDVDTMTIGSKWRMSTSNATLVFSSLSNAATAVLFRINFSNTTLNFTGQHRCMYQPVTGFNEADYLGRIMSCTGNYMDLSDMPVIHMDDAIPIVTLSHGRSNDKRVFGVASGFDHEGSFPLGYMTFQRPLKSPRMVVNSTGEGAIWVCNLNGPLECGDFITSSGIKGLGMRQNDDVIHNYTVAKITCDCDFQNQNQEDVVDVPNHTGLKAALVGCTYLL